MSKSNLRKINPQEQKPDLRIVKKIKTKQKRMQKIIEKIF